MTLRELGADLLKYCQNEQNECDYELSGKDADNLVDQLARVLILVDAKSEEDSAREAVMACRAAAGSEESRKNVARLTAAVDAGSAALAAMRRHGDIEPS